MRDGSEVGREDMQEGKEVGMGSDYNRKYSREYRQAGFGAIADKRYRERMGEELRRKDRERKRNKRKPQ